MDESKLTEFLSCVLIGVGKDSVRLDNNGVSMWMMTSGVANPRESVMTAVSVE